MTQSLLVSHRSSGMFVLNLSVWSLASNPHAAVSVLMGGPWACLLAGTGSFPLQGLQGFLLASAPEKGSDFLRTKA